MLGRNCYPHSSDLIMVINYVSLSNNLVHLLRLSSLEEVYLIIVSNREMCFSERRVTWYSFQKRICKMFEENIREMFSCL